MGTNVQFYNVSKAYRIETLAEFWKLLKQIDVVLQRPKYTRIEFYAKEQSMRYPQVY